MELILKEHLSLSDRVFEAIEKTILTGMIRPGERLVETTLAEKLGVSKSPVREALNRLLADGTVIFIPRKGYCVRSMNRKGVEDFFDIMFILEPAAASLSLKGRSQTVYEEIDRMLEDMSRCLQKADYESYRKLNDQFHAFFTSLTGNEWIIKIRQMLQKQAFLLRSLSLTENRFSSSLQEHQFISEAYKRGDEKMLTKAVKNHLKMFKKNILQADFIST